MSLPGFSGGGRRYGADAIADGDEYRDGPPRDTSPSPISRTPADVPPRQELGLGRGRGRGGSVASALRGMGGSSGRPSWGALAGEPDSMLGGAAGGRGPGSRQLPALSSDVGGVGGIGSMGVPRSGSLESLARGGGRTSPQESASGAGPGPGPGPGASGGGARAAFARVPSIAQTLSAPPLEPTGGSRRGADVVQGPFAPDPVNGGTRAGQRAGSRGGSPPEEAAAPSAAAARPGEKRASDGPGSVLAAMRSAGLSLNRRSVEEGDVSQGSAAPGVPDTADDFASASATVAADGTGTAAAVDGFARNRSRVAAGAVAAARDGAPPGFDGTAAAAGGAAAAAADGGGGAPRTVSFAPGEGQIVLGGAGEGSTHAQAMVLIQQAMSLLSGQPAPPGGFAPPPAVASGLGAMVAGGKAPLQRSLTMTGAALPTSNKVMSPFDDPNMLVPKKKEFDRPDDEWNMNHLKLLYLISKYSHYAQSSNEKEQWIRKLPLLVLLYEGVVQKVYEYDYAPASEVVENKRVYLNVSQEGKDDLDDLIEGKLVKGLRLSTKEHQSVTAYQIAQSGQALISKRLPDEERQNVDDLVFVDGQLLTVVWEDEKFVLRNDFVSRESTVTIPEEVSYVCSPYIPKALRRAGGQVMSSNAHRASESAGKEATIRDDLDEIITLSNVTILIGEWIPFGANQVVELNIKMGSNERCQGGYFTAQVDQDSTNTQCEVPAGLTSVQILDHDMTRFTNIEAEVYFPEEDGVVQVEHFGIHTRLDGTCVFGLMIESVMDRILENISLDNLARLLVDVHTDSSKIMDSIISNHQRDLLDMVFLGNTENRDKVNVIIADRIEPKKPAAKYMDKDELENEIRQVLGDTYEAFDLSDHDLVITGSHGILIVGPSSKKQESVLLAFLSLRARDIFVHNVFGRLFIVSDTLKRARLMIGEYEKDPNSIPRIRHILSETSKDIILLGEILLYLEESLKQDKSIYAEPATEAGQRLYAILQINHMLDDLEIRVEDMQKILEGAKNEVEGLRNMTDTVAETQSFRLQEEIRGNTADMLQQLKNNERQSTSLDVMQVIFAGSLAFDLLDRLTGEWSVVHTSWAREYIVGPFMNKPLVWFLISMATWFVVGLGVFKLMRNLNDKTAGTITYRIKVNKPIDLQALDEYLARKPVMAEDGNADKDTANQKVTWVERDVQKWEGYEPKIEMVYDMKHGFMLSVYIQITRRASEPARMRPETMKTRLFMELQENGVLAPDDAADIIDSTRQAHEMLGGSAAMGAETAVFLKVKAPSHKFYREIPFGMQTYIELRDEIAHKFAVKPQAVLQIHKHPDILISDDDDVIRLMPGTMLEVNLRAGAMAKEQRE